MKLERHQITAESFLNISEQMGRGTLFHKRWLVWPHHVDKILFCQQYFISVCNSSAFEPFPHLTNHPIVNKHKEGSFKNHICWCLQSSVYQWILLKVLLLLLLYLSASCPSSFKARINSNSRSKVVYFLVFAQKCEILFDKSKHYKDAYTIVILILILTMTFGQIFLLVRDAKLQYVKHRFLTLKFEH